MKAQIRPVSHSTQQWRPETSVATAFGRVLWITFPSWDKSISLGDWMISITVKHVNLGECFSVFKLTNNGWSRTHPSTSPAHTPFHLCWEVSLCQIKLSSFKMPFFPQLNVIKLNRVWGGYSPPPFPSAAKFEISKSLTCCWIVAAAEVEIEEESLPRAGRRTSQIWMNAMEN